MGSEPTQKEWEAIAKELGDIRDRLPILASVWGHTSLTNEMETVCQALNVLVIDAFRKATLIEKAVNSAKEKLDENVEKPSE